MNNQLIIMAKRPALGQVKTRLAARVGEEKALAIYQRLLNHTLQWTKPLRPVVYWTGSGHEPRHDFVSKEQASGDLGMRMSEAAMKELENADGFVIIGTDCPELDEAMVQEAYAHLTHCDVVIGPAHDGGYYLIAMRKHYPALFNDMPWSTEVVCEETILRCRRLSLSVSMLPTLSDVDEWDDILDVVHRQWLIS
jgi:rSAM/selenodomain-associated transferase 1